LALEFNKTLVHSGMQITEKKIKIGSYNLNYAVCGTGDPMIFLTNGGGFWLTWHHQIAYFLQRYKVHALDWPGCGSSDVFDKMPQLDYFLSILTEFIKQLHLKNLIIAGNCIGASIALKYNVLFPENVKNLILFNICPGDRIFPNKTTRNFVNSLNNLTYIKPIIGELIRLSIIYTPLKLYFPAMLFKKTRTEIRIYISR
jgi:pimeloyl-ACP methyl ester carboxylesterase